MKIAFLITAYNHQKVLQELINRLNNKCFYLYIHIDKKTTFDVKRFIEQNANEHVKFIRQTDVQWGDYSLVAITLKLLQKALKDNCDFYCSLSGVDLPIKTNEYIIDFFSKNKDCQFISCFNKQKMEKDRQALSEWLYKYHIIPPKINKINLLLKIKNKFYRLLSKIGFYPNQRYSYDYFRKGSNYFAINNDFAKYLINKKRLIHKLFKHTYCADEFYIQTIFYHSHFNKRKDKITYIDWVGLFNNDQYLPTTIDKRYLPILKKTKLLFARKFDDNFDKFYYKIFK